MGRRNAADLRDRSRGLGLTMLKKLLDPYERKARLAPALLALVPPIGVMVVVYGIDWQPKSALGGFLVSAGIFYLLATIARELGKRLETDLFARWGGKPTTQLLRHRDNTLDPITKRRYHHFLAAQIATTFPDAEEERRDFGAADHAYAAGARWLLEQTRDTAQFPLLFAENIAYGFRRNCLGLKWIALTIVGASTMWVAVADGMVGIDGIHWGVLHSAPVTAWTSMSISLMAGAVWLLFVTPRTMKTAAFSYADMLLRSCDVLAKQK